MGFMTVSSDVSQYMKPMKAMKHMKKTLGFFERLSGRERPVLFLRHEGLTKPSLFFMCFMTFIGFMS